MAVLFQLITLCLVFVCQYHSLNQLNFHKIFFWDCNFQSIILYSSDHFSTDLFVFFVIFRFFCTSFPIFLSFSVTFLGFFFVVLLLFLLFFFFLFPISYIFFFWVLFKFAKSRPCSNNKCIGYQVYYYRFS